VSTLRGIAPAIPGVRYARLLASLEPTVAFGLLAIWYVKIPVLSLPTFVAAVIASLTVVAATTIAWDEAELSNSAPPGKGQRPRPFAWFFFVLGFWAIAYPAHMFRRRRRLPPGLQAVANSGVALLLTVALLLMSTHFSTSATCGSRRSQQTRRKLQDLPRRRKGKWPHILKRSKNYPNLGGDVRRIESAHQHEVRWLLPRTCRTSLLETRSEGPAW